jgi:hypothetical protein
VARLLGSDHGLCVEEEVQCCTLASWSFTCPAKSFVRPPKSPRMARGFDRNKETDGGILGPSEKWITNLKCDLVTRTASHGASFLPIRMDDKLDNA